MPVRKEKNIREEDIYMPVKEHLISLGYTVRSEVKDCDVMAVKGNELLVVEMKVRLNLDVIIQAVLRQRIADKVYIAVPKPGRELFSKRWKNICHLLKRLGIGLLLIPLNKSEQEVFVAFEPQEFDTAKSKAYGKKKRAEVVKEFEARYDDFNVGGSTGKKLVTAYREMALHIACCLEKHGPLSAKQLTKLGTDKEKTWTILYTNHYGWFENVSKGVYILNSKGLEEIRSYRKLYKHYTNVCEGVFN